MTKEELAEVVRGIVSDHAVRIRYQGWDEKHPFCDSCGYLGDKEPHSLHAANIVLEYLEEHYKERFSNEQTTT